MKAHIEKTKMQALIFAKSESVNSTISIISDNEFIKGEIRRSFIPQGNEGYFKITKGAETRIFILDKYYDIHMSNWEKFIAELTTKAEKLQAIANAIFDLQKEEYNNSHPAILGLITKNLDHLNAIKKYIIEEEEN